jgi:hypothetical protein
VLRKLPADINAGEHIWCFVMNTYAPEVTGHFRFVEALGNAAEVALDAVEARWFTANEGPTILVPNDWVLFGDGTTEPVTVRRRVPVYSFPGHVYGEIPAVPGLDLFRPAIQSVHLNEQVAYFLGAFAVRPYCYTMGQGAGRRTWAIFGVRLNPTGTYGTSRPERIAAHAVWVEQHVRSLRTLAESVWGPGNFLVEQRGAPLGLPNIALPNGHTPYPTRGAVVYAIHAPIAQRYSLDSTGRQDDRDLRLIQYWYSALQAPLLERASASVKQAFLLGAYDTISDQDRDTARRTGLDFKEAFHASLPTYSVVHTVGSSMLDTFDRTQLNNPREFEGRVRGRIVRCKIWEQVERIGFLSGFRFARSVHYDASLTTRPQAAMPAPNVLSVILGTPVQSVEQGPGYGSDERALGKHPLFATGVQRQGAFVRISIRQQNAYPVSSLPLGTRPPIAVPAIRLPGQQSVELDRNRWKVELLERLFNLDRYVILQGNNNRPPNDETFEFLIAVLVSTFPGCSDSWVVPLEGDRGADVGASFDLGPRLGNVTAIFQAKLFGQSVGRPVVDQLRGALFRYDAALGYVVTNNTFSPQAIESARRDHPRVRLITGERLAEMMLANRVGLSVSGAGARQRIRFSVEFFTRLRTLARGANPVDGQIRVMLDAAGWPVLRP